MRRQVKRIAVCVVVGVVVNVLVAWGCALWINARKHLSFRTGSTHASELHWPAAVPDDWPERCTALGVDVGFGVRASNGVATTSDSFGYWSCSLRETGWPMYSLRAVQWVTNQVEGTARYSDLRYVESSGFNGLWRAGLAVPIQFTWMAGTVPTLPKGSLIRVPLPIQPRWRGFAVNTIAYSALTWGVLFAPGVVRRWRRRGRGACVGCGYELAGLVRCPECGSGEERAESQKV